MRFVLYLLIIIASRNVSAGEINNLKKFGSNWSGFYYPESLDGLDSNSVVYCVGCCDDIAHDFCLSGALGCKVHLFDPTPVAIEHFKLLKGVLNGTHHPSDYKMGSLRIAKFHSNDDLETNHHHQVDYWKMLNESGVQVENLIFHPVGLYINDGNITFHFNTSSEQAYIHSEHSGGGEEKFIAPVKKLATIMRELGHDHIDLLKIDIEGVECEVLNQMIEERIFPKYLSVDFDLGWTVENQNRRECLRVIKRLKKVGYKQISGTLPDVTFVFQPKRR